MTQSNNAGGLARRFVWGIGLAVLLGSTALVVRAFNPQPDPPGVYANIGINPFETLRLHVVNIGGTNGTPPDPCRVRLAFLGPGGQVVKSIGGTLAPGQSAFLDFNFTEVPTDVLAAARRHVRPVFEANTADGCFATSSAEVFETNTGQSHIFATPSIQHLSGPGNSQ